MKAKDALEDGMPVSPVQSGNERPGEETVLPRVLEIVRALALETGGPRAAQAATPEASLDRDVGLGSLERVELSLRLEEAFGRDIEDEALVLDTPAQLARAIREAGPIMRTRPAPPVALPPTRLDRAAHAATLHEALWTWADAEPDRPHVFLRENGTGSGTLTYSALRNGAAAIAGGLASRQVAPGETVALMLPTGVDFLRSFMGILLAGAIPVPLYPPVRLDRLEDYFRRQQRILENAQARLLITVPEAAPVARALRGSGAVGLTTISADDLAAVGTPPASATGSSSDPALIQYTSGSTGDPKGVLLDHGALLANIRAIAAAAEVQPTDVGVSWLPLYHDMGLIGTWLNSLYHGVPLALMPPLSFLARPESWLWTIHQHRATLSVAPNFAYELCVRKIADEALEGLDLSSWRCALNGSEAVSAGTLARFTRRFEPYGFRCEAFMPAYGLAESTVALSFTRPGRGPRIDTISREPFEHEGRAEPAVPGKQSPLEFVSAGAPLPGHEVRIVNDRGEDLPEGRIGHLLFRGASTMTGYYRNPEATAAVTRPGGWIDTGDLAYLRAGELYVTGREKDLIIQAGRNLVPEEIELVAASVEGVRRGCVAAFGVADPESGTERLIVAAETRRTEPDELAALRKAVIARVAEAIDLPPDEVVLLPPGSVPKTSSGKIRRSAAREWYGAGRLGVKQAIPLRIKLELLRSWTVGAARAASARARRVGYLAYLGLAGSAAALLVGLPIWALVAALPGRRPARALERIAARIALRITRCETSIEGRENLPAKGPVILAANHASMADSIVLLACLPLDLGVVGKKELLDWPIVGTFVRRAQHPTVDRWDFRKSVADSRAIAARLGAGETILFFPEGTYTPAAGLRPFRLGAFEAAVETGTPVIPIALRGTRQILPPGTLLPRPGSAHVWIGEPIVPEGDGWSAAIALRDRVADAIAAHCGEPRLELVAGGPLRP
jgi:fatty-acyl-CoA synthase